MSIIEGKDGRLYREDRDQAWDTDGNLVRDEATLRDVTDEIVAYVAHQRLRESATPETAPIIDHMLAREVAATGHVPVPPEVLAEIKRRQKAK